MSYWIKISYERNEYIIDLDGINAFALAPNGKITFWLPDSGLAIILNRQGDPDGYQQVLNFVKNISVQSLTSSWLRVIYERSEYVIDLNRISNFCSSLNGKLTFWLPDSHIPIIVNKQSEPEVYSKLLDYIKRKTGYGL